MTYPRIATCRVTGVKTIVEKPEEERQFHRSTSVPLLCLFLMFIAFTVVFFAVLLLR